MDFRVRLELQMEVCCLCVFWKRSKKKWPKKKTGQCSLGEKLKYTFSFVNKILDQTSLES